MKQITLSELKKLGSQQIKELLPFEITFNCEVIAEMKSPGEVAKQPEEDISKYKTKCPNCKLVYQAEKPDNKPNFLSMQQK